MNKGVWICSALMAVCFVGRGQNTPGFPAPRQAVLVELSGSYYYVAHYGTIDLDSAMIVASRSLGISLLPLMTESLQEEIPASLSTWVGKDDVAAGKDQLQALNGMARLQELYLLGSWYAFQSTAHSRFMDSAIGFLTKARSMAEKMEKTSWVRRCSGLIGKAYLGKQDTVSGNSWFRRTIDECQLAGDLQGEATAWRDWCNYSPVLPALSMERIGYLKRAQDIYIRLKNNYPRINTLMHIGYLNYSIGRFPEANAAFGEAIGLEDSLRWPYTHYTTDLLALVAQGAQRYGDMLRSALRTIKSAEGTRDSLCWPTFYERMSEVYENLPTFQGETIYWSKKCFERALRSGDRTQAYLYLDPLVDALDDDNQADAALTLIRQLRSRYPPANALDSMSYYVLLQSHASRTGDTASDLKYAQPLSSEERIVVATRPWLAGRSELNMGGAWFRHGDYKRSEPLLRAFLSSIYAKYQPHFLLAAYRMLLTIDTATGHLAAAASDYHRFWVLDSSNFSVMQARQVDILKVQYEVDEKQKDILLLQTQTRLQEHQLQQAALVRGVAVGGVALLLVISGLLYNRYRLKQRVNRQLQSQKDEIDRQNAILQNLVGEKDTLLDTKDWLLKEVHHRVKNNLQMIVSLLDSQTDFLSSDALTAIRDSQNRVFSISLIHQKLYQDEDMARVNMASYLGELITYLRDSYDIRNKIKFELDIAPLTIDISQAVRIGLILNEALTNSIKHAFPAKSKGNVISVSILVDANNVVDMTIADNGVGIPVGVSTEMQRSLGLKLMRGLTEELGGTFSMVSENGTTVRIRFVAKGAMDQTVGDSYGEITTKKI